MTTFLCSLATLSAGLWCGFKFGVWISHEYWVDRFRDYGWRVVDDDGQVCAPVRLYGAHWYDRHEGGVH